MKISRTHKAIATAMLSTVLATGMAFAQGGEDISMRGPRIPLSTEDITALKAARDAKDMDAVMAILEKNGLMKPFNTLSNLKDKMKKPEGGEGMDKMKGMMEDLTKNMSEEDKAALKAAHEAKDMAAEKAILDKYGIKPPMMGGDMGMGKPMGSMMDNKFKEMSDEDKAALKTAHENKDKDAEKAILDKYGIKPPMMGEMKRPEGPKMEDMLQNASEEDKAALKAAHEAKDYAAEKAILDKYGIKLPMPGQKDEKYKFKDVLQRDTAMSDEDKAALLEAIKNKDGDAAKTILMKYRK